MLSKHSRICRKIQKRQICTSIRHFKALGNENSAYDSEWNCLCIRGL